MPLPDEKTRKPRLLAAMAHPDDAEILVGGTLGLLADAGWDLGILTMTAGDCGSATRSREEISRIRLEEARSAAGFIGAWYGCAGLCDIEVFAGPESIRAVVEQMRRFAPDAVITHSPVDYMLDHEETSRIVRGAAFALAMPLYLTGSPDPAPPAGATPALYYADPVEGIDSLGNRIRPQFYLDIGGRIEQKRRMLSFHASQREWLRAHHGVDEYLNRMTEWAAAYGRECGTGYAEGLRQHLGHGYPHDPLIQQSLRAFILNS